MASILWISCVMAPMTWLLMSSLDVRQWRDRRLMVMGVLVLFVLYLIWRGMYTVLWGDFSFAGVFTQFVMLVEILWFFDVMHSLHFYAYPEQNKTYALQAGLRNASVDVIVPTYNEPAHVLERTLMAASNLAWIGEVRVYILDDGKREWLPQLCKTWGATYISRPDNQSAKAGNINHALRYMHGDFTLVLDADFMVDPQAIEKLIAPMSDPAVAVVQAPQEFYNPDPIQRSLGLSDTSPTDQSYFFNSVLQARNNGDAAFFCGSCGLLRNSALKALGGFPTESITEDIFLSIKLKTLGYQSVSISEPVAVGMSPETIDDLIKQRSRWGLGAIQMNARLWLGQQARQAGVSIITKLKFLPVHWLLSFPVRMISMLLPQVYFLFGWEALVNVSLTDLVIAQGSLALTLIFFNRLTSGRHQQPFVTSIWHDLLALRLTHVFLINVFRPFAERQFVVTPKGQDGSQKGATRLFDWYVTFLLVMTMMALFVGFYENQNSALSNVSLFWTFINFFRILFVQAALRHEKPLVSFEMTVPGRQLPQLWLEGGQLQCPIAQCEVSESRVLNNQRQPVANALVQLNTSHGLNHIGRTNTAGQIEFFNAQKKSVWISHLVGANLRKIGQPDALGTTSWHALWRTVKTSFIRTSL